MTGAALVLAWLAAVYRVWVSITRPATVWRTSFTLAMVSVAIAFTLHEVRGALDAAVGQPNVANLLSHLVTILGIAFLLIYHEHLRHSVVPARVVALHVSVAAFVLMTELLAWSIAPVHLAEADNLTALAASRPVLVYCSVYWLYLAAVFAVASRTCLAGGRTFRRSDPARSASLVLIGLGELVAIPVVLLWTLSLGLEHAGRDSREFNRAGDLLLPWPVLLVALGVLALLMVPYIGALVTRHRQWRVLRPLWRDLVQLYPQVHLDLQPAGGPLNRLNLRVERAVIEIRDALRVAPVDADSERPIPIEAVARSLRRRVASDVSLAEVLPRPETRETDVRQLIDIARAYEEASHANA